MKRIKLMVTEEVYYEKEVDVPDDWNNDWDEENIEYPATRLWIDLGDPNADFCGVQERHVEWDEV